MFRTGDKADFERMLDDILARAKVAAASTAAQVTAESSARGRLMSSGTPVLMEQGVTPIHETALADAMRIFIPSWSMSLRLSDAHVLRYSFQTPGSAITPFRVSLFT